MTWYTWQNWCRRWSWQNFSTFFAQSLVPVSTPKLQLIRGAHKNIFIHSNAHYIVEYDGMSNMCHYVKTTVKQTFFWLGACWRCNRTKMASGNRLKKCDFSLRSRLDLYPAWPHLSREGKNQIRPVKESNLCRAPCSFFVGKTCACKINLF